MKVPPVLVRRLAGPPIRLLASTWRFRTVHEERWHDGIASGRPRMLLCWHDALLPLTWLHRGQGMVILVSQARDGQYLADFASGLGYLPIRGSSTRGGARALLGVVRELRRGRAVAITPDGPRGPRRVLKPGALAAAQQAGALVQVAHADAEPGWRLDSWDRLLVPKPWARVRVRYGRPFDVAPGEQGLAEATARAAREFEELTQGGP